MYPKWTRGTGGVFRGDNEINDEETDRGKTTAAAHRGNFASYQHAEPTFRL